MTVVAYTDASHCPKLHIAACGYCLLAAGRLIKHSITLLDNISSPGKAEKYAITEGLQAAFLVKGVSGIIIKTDYKGAVNQFEDGAHKGELKETIEMIREYGISIQFSYVRAHRGHYYNTIIDESCRKELRKLRKKYAPNSIALR